MVTKLLQLAALPTSLLMVALTVAPRPTGRAAASAEVVHQPAAFFAAAAAPDRAVELGAARAGRARPESAWFQVTVLAELPDPEAAARVADELAELFERAARHLEHPEHAAARERLQDDRHPAPLTPAEAEAFERHGLSSAIGCGWPGASDEAREAPQVLGPWVLVGGLKGDFAQQRPNPLAALLAAQGARVLVAGDPGVELAPRVDLTCLASDADAARGLERATRHYLEAPASFALRPPWHPAGVSQAQARARASWAALARAARAAVEEATAELAARYARARGRGDYERLLEEYRAAIAARLVAAIDELSGDEAHDPAVLEDVRRSITSAREPARELEGELEAALDLATRRRLAERMGALSVELQAAAEPGAPARLAPTLSEMAFGARGRVQLQGRRLELGGLAFHHLAGGLPALLLWLQRAGCSDARLAASDRDRAQVAWGE